MAGKYLDAVMATVVLVLSGALSFSAYRALATGDPMSRAEIGRVEEGTRRAFLVDRGRCVGVLETLHEHQEMTRLRAEADIAARVGGRERPLHLEVEGFFNPLGQLLRSTGTARYLDAMITMQTSDVHPIVLEVAVRNAEKVFVERRFELPGPVMLLKDRAGSFALEFPGLVSALPASFRNVPLRSGFAPVLEREPAPAEGGCPPDRIGALDLDSGSTPLARLLPQLTALLNTAGSL